MAIDVLGFLLADEKDVFLCPVPGYGSYFQAAKQRCNIEIVSVPFEYEIRVSGNKSKIKMILKQVFPLKIHFSIISGN